MGLPHSKQHMLIPYEIHRLPASRKGVTYQTLIASVLHKYVTDQLYDEQEIRKTLELIESSSTE